MSSLRWLRGRGLLDTDTLGCLPLDPGRFEDSMFGEVFDVTKAALKEEALLPAHGGGHVSAGNGRLARTQELRGGLLEPGQLAAPEGANGPLRWVDGRISQDRNPALMQYLMHVLGMTELTPDGLLAWLDEDVLENQHDAWIRGL